MKLAGTIVKRTVHNNFSGLFFGLPFTKLNPEFVKSVRNEFSQDSKLLLVCQEGLRLVEQALAFTESHVSMKKMLKSFVVWSLKRSAAAASRLEEAGYDNIACVTSGLQSVKPGLIPFSCI